MRAIDFWWAGKSTGGDFLGGGRGNEQILGWWGGETHPIAPVGKILRVVTKYGKSNSLLSETVVTTYGNPFTAY